MSDLEVTIFNQKLKLKYQESEKRRLINAVDKLNKTWNKFSKLSGKVTDLKIISLISLELQDSIEDYKSKLNMQKEDIDLLRKEIEKRNGKLENSIEVISKLKLEINQKNEKIINIESTLDQIYQELKQLKSNFLIYKDESDY